MVIDTFVYKTDIEFTPVQGEQILLFINAHETPDGVHHPTYKTLDAALEAHGFFLVGENRIQSNRTDVSFDDIFLIGYAYASVGCSGLIDYASDNGIERCSWANGELQQFTGEVITWTPKAIIWR